MAISSSLAVLAAAVRRAQTRSAHGDGYELVALVMKKDEAACRPALEGLGYRVVAADLPVQVDSMKYPLRGFAETNTGSNKHKIVEEHLHLHLWTLGGFDKVVYMDTDVLMLDAIDDLVDDAHEVVGIYDYYGWDSTLSVIPPINGGFLVMRPSNATFRDLVAMIRRGSFSSQGVKQGFVAGWDMSGIGYYFGGISLQGLLSAKYHMDLVRKQSDWRHAFERVRHDPVLQFKEVDACEINNLCHPNCLGREAGVQGTADCRNVDCSPTVNPTVESVKARARVAHFTGSCAPMRPWDLCEAGSPIPSEESSNPLGVFFAHRWVEIAREAVKDPAVAKWAPHLAECVRTLDGGASVNL